jgi:hypothetical protein
VPVVAIIVEQTADIASDHLVEVSASRSSCRTRSTAQVSGPVSVSVSFATANGNALKVIGIGWATRRVATAYNLTIADIHTYHVGQSEILVHNDC